ncbi:hypothetical protein [Undibacterium sp. TC9W]|uniref:hypothetical protein n=1 Tax=Undibacterium sp. TC9W TaxID=3413053 RepID=UPI003BF09475
MKAWVTRLWEEGRQLPPWRHGGIYPVLGEVSFCEATSPEMRRNLHQVHVFDYRHGPSKIDMLPPLLDAKLVSMSGDILSFSGLETSMGKTTAQTWRVVLYREGEPNV